MNKFAVWFRRFMWLGIIQDWLIGLPAIFAPHWLLNLLGQRASQDPVWTSFAGLLVFLLSLFYVPAAIDPYRYTLNAWLATFCRPPGILFFFFLYPGYYPTFGIIDSVLFVLQLSFLIPTMVGKPQAVFNDQDKFEYDGSTFAQVKKIGFSEPYSGQLPYNQGLGLGTILQFINDSARNMFDRRDIRPKYQKLIHANGVCMTGIWRITEDNPYTGYFAKGSEGLVFARLSVAGQAIKKGERRAFGMGGKIFPKMEGETKVKPATFVLIDYLSGSKNPHITDTEMTNFPSVGKDPAANFVNRIIFRLMDTRPGFRQLFPIATLGLTPESTVVTPDLLMLRVADDTAKIDAEDFRDELRLEKYPDHQLVYWVHVKNFGDKEWIRLGEIVFTEYCIGEGCDTRTHFWIPRDLPTPASRDHAVAPVPPTKALSALNKEP